MRRQEKTETNLENLFPRLVVFCLLLSSLSFTPTKRYGRERDYFKTISFCWSCKGERGEEKENKTPIKEKNEIKIYFYFLGLFFYWLFSFSFLSFLISSLYQIPILLFSKEKEVENKRNEEFGGWRKKDERERKTMLKIKTNRKINGRTFL